VPWPKSTGGTTVMCTTRHSPKADMQENPGEGRSNSQPCKSQEVGSRVPRGRETMGVIPKKKRSPVGGETRNMAKNTKGRKL